MKNYNDFRLKLDFKNFKHKNSLILLEKLHSLKFEFQISSHPPLRTVEDSQKFRNHFKGGFTKNLFLRDKKKRNFLITLEENQYIDLKALPQIISSDRLSFGSPERLFEFLKVTPGSVSPLSLINDKNNEVSFFIDLIARPEPWLSDTLSNPYMLICSIAVGGGVAMMRCVKLSL